MSLPIMGLDGQLRQYLEIFLCCFSVPQYQHFVTVLVGLMQCEGRSTLSGLSRWVAQSGSLSSLSRFLSRAPWSAEQVAQCWQGRFAERLAPQVEAEHRRQAASRPKQRGHPVATVVTGYLIGDDSTQHKVRGEKMEGLGQHYSTTEAQTVSGHSLVQGLYVLLGQHCPLLPKLYQQEAVCERADKTFHSKVHLMGEVIRCFEPVAHTTTHVLVDTWYTCKYIWRLARERGFLITSGLKSNRCLRVEDSQAASGWRWQSVTEYAASLPASAYQKMVWPNGDHKTVFVHVIATRVRKLYRCQVIIIRSSLDCPPKAMRYWVSSDLEADVYPLVEPIAMRWKIEVFFEDVKDVLGFDHYQLMSTIAILRFWALIMTAYAFLDEQRVYLSTRQHSPITIGQARRTIQHSHYCHLLDWLYRQFSQGYSPAQFYDLLVA
jgi:SRSO17 transposase